MAEVSQIVQEAVAKQATTAKHEAKAEASKKQANHEPQIVVLDTGRDLHKLLLPKSEEDPFWDARLNMDVPEEVVNALAERDLPETITVVADGDNYRVRNGKTRVRAIPEANRLRKKAGRAPVRLTLAVVEDSDDPAEVIRAMLLANVRLNSPPTVVAMEVSRALAADVPESWIVAHVNGVSNSKKLHEFLALLDLPKKIQKFVDEGTITLSAALELTKVDEKEVEQIAEKLAAASKLGRKVGASAIKKSDPDSKIATKKEIRQYVLDIQSDAFAGKHGKAVTQAMILGIEVCLGFRSLAQATSAGTRVARGEEVKFDLKQYQTEK